MERTLSTIIPTYDQFELTRAHVRESMNCSRSPDEVIVINDGGKENLREMLLNEKRTCPVVYARIQQDIFWNYSGACNLGAWLSNGDYLAFEDTDNIPSYDFYEQAIDVIENNPNCGRVQARNRKIVELKDMLTKSKQDWEIIGKMGANMGTAIIPRDVYLKVKGHDERFSGRYGWMYYDWRSRLLGQLKVDFHSVGDYFYTRDGQSNLERIRRGQNLNYYRENARENRVQHPEGILKFNYTYEVFPRN